MTLRKAMDKKMFLPRAENILFITQIKLFFFSMIGSIRKYKRKKYLSLNGTILSLL